MQRKRKRFVFNYKLDKIFVQFIIRTYKLKLVNISIQKMGNCQHIVEDMINHTSIIVIATLNYGGILNSPFEFYSNSQEQQIKLSEIFKSLLSRPQYFPDFDQKTFAWKIGKIDQKIQKERYTPIYTPTVGVQQGKLISAKQFQQKWRQHFEKAQIKAKLQKPFTKQQKDVMEKFDLVCYHTLLAYAYKIKSIEEVENKQPSDYLILTKRFFSRSYLDQGRKIDRLSHLLYQEIFDIFFIQEPTQELLKHIQTNKKYHVESHQKQKDASIIAVNKSKFKIIKNVHEVSKQFGFTEEQLKKIQSNKQTRILFCQNKYILICVHLSSKQQKNRAQLKQLRQTIHIFKTKCPKYEFIVGGDTNAFIKKEEAVDPEDLQKVNIFPCKQENITTCKKRTFIQPQFNKANKVASEIKDQIITTLQIRQTNIWTITGEVASQKLFLPTQEHPFDHFMVRCQLLIHE